MNQNDQAQIDKAFCYHPPAEGQVPRYQEIRDRARELAAYLTENCPPSRERWLAITKLEEMVMWANASISRNE